MTNTQPVVVPEPGTQVTVDGQMVTVLAATETLAGAELVFRWSDGSLGEASLDAADLRRAHVPVNDAGGHPERALTGLWGRWMQYAVPRIRSAVLATRPLRPFAHQDEAVFTYTWTPSSHVWTDRPAGSARAPSEASGPSLTSDG